MNEALGKAYEYCLTNRIPVPTDLKADLLKLGVIDCVKALHEYDNALHRIVSIYIGDLRTKPLHEIGPFAVDFANAIETGLNEAWRLGMRENDVSEMDEDGEMQEIVDGIVASEREHIPDFAEYITTVALNAETMGEAITGVEGRLQMWIGRYNDVLTQAIIYTAEEKSKMVWLLGATEQHCPFCRDLNGIVAYAREWDEAGLQPRNPPNPGLTGERDGEKGCGGWRCDCTLVPTTEKKTRNALQRLLAIAGRGVE